MKSIITQLAKVLSVIKHHNIPFVEYQIIAIENNQYTVQNFYTGVIEVMSEDKLSSEYYYVYDSNNMRYQK